MAAVRLLGYSPNYAAQVLAANRSGTFGAIIPTMENPVFARGVQAFQETLGAAGINLLIASSSYSAVREEEQIRTLLARGADALLLIGYQREPALYDLLRSRKVPTLVAWSWRPDPPCPSVGFDNRRSMRDMVAAVINRGHSRIAMISAKTADNDRAAERVDGLRDAAIAVTNRNHPRPELQTSGSNHTT